MSTRLRSWRLFVSTAVHMAVVDVNEEGTEAAAATGFGVKAAAFIPPVGFVADRPCLFLIRHNPNCAILFWGAC